MEVFLAAMTKFVLSSSWQCKWRDLCDLLQSHRSGLS